ncbi:hypothetical protein C8Q75DRAFT_776410 [Abortiporus biennis]|nr:hypothetical protein C8Q75DRAFT_776410 [Abortiporus biennis]
MANSANGLHDLLFSLIPSVPYLLAYSIPLLLLSTVLTFAGAFLTLDRTRTFPQHHSSSQKPSLLRRLFTGGIGGYISGYAFGVHFSTFLSLLIPSLTTSAPLSPISFTMTWVLSSITCAGLAGRWRIVAFIMAAAIGFSTLALSISVIVHPNLLTRIVLVSVFTFIGILSSLLTPPKYSHIPMRLATSTSGAFGMVLAIALLAHLPSWGNVWERLWVNDSLEWGNAKEKAMSVAYCLLLASGIVCDWLIHAKIGENPDEKWDHYLADYSTGLPYNQPRSGLFSPPVSLWERLTKFHLGFHPVLQPQVYTNTDKEEAHTGELQTFADFHNLPKKKYSINFASYQNFTSLSDWDDENETVVNNTFNLAKASIHNIEGFEKDCDNNHWISF